jgi:tetratricopeptide (TPR) repeat protein
MMRVSTRLQWRVLIPHRRMSYQSTRARLYTTSSNQHHIQQSNQVPPQLLQQSSLTTTTTTTFIEEIDHDVMLFNSWFAQDKSEIFDDYFVDDNSLMRFPNITDHTLLKIRKSQGMEAVEKYFASLENPRKVDYDQMIINYGMVSHVEKATEMFEKCKQSFFPHTNDILSTVIYGAVLFGASRFSEAVTQLLSIMNQPTFSRKGFSILIASYLRLCQLQSAIDVLNIAHNRGLTFRDYLYNRIIVVALSLEQVDIAIKMFRQMISYKIEPSSEITSKILEILIRSERLEDSKMILVIMKKLNHTPKVHSLTKHLELLGHGDPQQLTNWFLLVYRMFPNLEVTSTLLREMIDTMRRTTFRKEDLQELISKLRTLAEKEETTETLTLDQKVEQFDALIASTAVAHDFSQVQVILSQMDKQKVPIRDSTRLEILYVASYCELEHAIHLFEQERLLLQNELTYRHFKIMIRAYLRLGMRPHSECIPLIEEMRDRNLLSLSGKIEQLIDWCYEYSAIEILIYVLKLTRELFPNHRLAQTRTLLTIETLTDQGQSLLAKDMLLAMETEIFTLSSPILQKCISGLIHEGEPEGVLDLFYNTQHVPGSDVIINALDSLLLAGYIEVMWETAIMCCQKFPQSINFKTLSTLLQLQERYDSESVVLDDDMVVGQYATVFTIGGHSLLIRQPAIQITEDKMKFIFELYDNLLAKPSKFSGELTGELLNLLLGLCEKYPAYRSRVASLLKRTESSSDVLQELLIRAFTLIRSAQADGQQIVPSPLHDTIMKNSTKLLQKGTLSKKKIRIIIRRGELYVHNLIT